MNSIQFDNLTDILQRFEPLPEFQLAISFINGSAMPPDERLLRLGLDRVLDLYGVLEMAAMVGAIPEPLPEHVFFPALHRLSSAVLRMHMQAFPPRVLPYLFELRLRRWFAIHLSESNDGWRWFERFMDIVALMNGDDVRAAFCSLLYDSWNTVTMDDILTLLTHRPLYIETVISNPHADPDVITVLSGIDVIESAIHNMFSASGTADEGMRVRSGIWHYFAYLFIGSRQYVDAILNASERGSEFDVSETLVDAMDIAKVVAGDEGGWRNPLLNAAKGAGIRLSIRDRAVACDFTNRLGLVLEVEQLTVAELSKSADLPLQEVSSLVDSGRRVSSELGKVVIDGLNAALQGKPRYTLDAVFPFRESGVPVTPERPPDRERTGEPLVAYEQEANITYRVYQDGSNETVAQVEAAWPLLQAGEKIPISVSGKDSLYTISRVGELRMQDGRVVVDIWVRDLFPLRT